MHVSFQKATHQYAINGTPVPSVTTVLKAAGYYSGLDGIPPDILENARVRGNEVHAYISGDLPRHLLNQPAVPYADAWDSFVQLSQFEVIRQEELLGCMHYGFAGTLDVVGKLTNRVVLLDVKTTAVLNIEATSLQTAAYVYLHNQKFEPYAEDRFALHLKKTGRYALVPLRGHNDLGRFLSHLRTYQRTA